LDYDYCFNCIINLSQSVFNKNDMGDNLIVVTLEDRCGNKSVDSININITINTKINNVNDSDIIIYPNPAQDLITVNTDNNKYRMIELFDINGKQITYLPIIHMHQPINTSKLETGIYFLKIYSTYEVVTKKIIIE